MQRRPFVEARISKRPLSKRQPRKSSSDEGTPTIEGVDDRTSREYLYDSLSGPMWISAGHDGQSVASFAANSEPVRRLQQSLDTVFKHVTNLKGRREKMLQHMTSSGMSWLIIRPDVLGDILRKLVYFFTNAKGNNPTNIITGEKFILPRCK
jgi:hypothetical protein